VVLGVADGNECLIDKVESEAQSSSRPAAEPSSVELACVLIDVGDVDAEIVGNDVGCNPW